jgi:hypothetical protein
VAKEKLNETKFRVRDAPERQELMEWRRSAIFFKCKLSVSRQVKRLNRRKDKFRIRKRKKEKQSFPVIKKNKTGDTLPQLRPPFVFPMSLM